MGYWGVTCGCFLLAEKAQVYGRHDFRGIREELLKNDCLLAADKMKTSTDVGQTASNSVDYGVMQEPRGRV